MNIQLTLAISLAINISLAVALILLVKRFKIHSERLKGILRENISLVDSLHSKAEAVQQLVKQLQDENK